MLAERAAICEIADSLRGSQGARCTWEKVRRGIVVLLKHDVQVRRLFYPCWSRERCCSGLIQVQFDRPREFIP